MTLTPLADDPEEQAFVARYGPWDPATIGEISAWLEGWERPWWIAGGWAIEAFTGVAREHGDVDVAIFRRDVPALHDHLGADLHLWAAGSGLLRPLLFPAAGITDPTLPSWSSQLWLRRRATEPWLLDVVATDDENGKWVSRMDPTWSRPLEEVIWRPTHGPFAGICLLRPEIVLAYKAKPANPKDDADLASSLPLLDDDQVAVARHLIGTAHPGHRWLALLDR